MHLLMSGAPFMFKSALQILGTPVFRIALQLPTRPQYCGEAFTFFDAPARLWRHRGSEALAPGSEAPPVSEGSYTDSPYRFLGAMLLGLP